MLKLLVIYLKEKERQTTEPNTQQNENRREVQLRHRPNARERRVRTEALVVLNRQRPEAPNCHVAIIGRLMAFDKPLRTFFCSSTDWRNAKSGVCGGAAPVRRASSGVGRSRSGVRDDGSAVRPARTGVCGGKFGD